MDLSRTIERLKKYTKVRKDKDLAAILGLSPANFNNRKKIGTLLAPITEWAISDGVDLNWLLTGRESSEGEGAYSGKVNTSLLQGVIKGVEDYLIKGELMLDPEPKARLVAILYDRFDVADEDVNPRIVSDYLKLVA